MYLKLISYMKLYVFFAVFILSSSIFSQDKNDAIATFESVFDRLLKENKKDSLFVLVNDFEKKTNLSPFENQFILYYKSIYYKKLSKHKVALGYLISGLKYRDFSKKSEELVTNSYYHLSDSYFTVQDFDKANFYAVMAIKNMVLNKESYNKYIDLHSIIGFYQFRQTDYKSSILQYNLAIDASRKFNPCKVSEVKNKVAKIYSKLNQFDKAVLTIKESILRADSCQEKINKVNALRSYREILLENNRIDKANVVYLEIETLLSDIEATENISRYDSLEAAYKSKFKDQENLSLKALNFQKEEVLKKQKTALLATIIGLIVLGSLLFFVFLLSKKQRKTNSELELQKLKIEQNNKNLNRLNLLNQKIFSVISHDFKAPITTLKLLLSKEEITETENPLITTYIKEINSQLEQADDMLQSLLDWAKTELGFEDHALYTTNLFNGIEIIKNQLHKKYLEKEIDINILVEKDCKVQFPTSIFLIVVRNIISNAIKFSHEKSVIEIYFEDNILYVKDFGKGIESKKLTKLFKQSINPGLGTNYESGFGLGLYLSNELMMKNNGKIAACNNKETSGCTFSIHFPKR